MLIRNLLTAAAGAAVLAAPAVQARTAPAQVTEASVVLKDGTYQVAWKTSRPGAPVDLYVSGSPSAPLKAMRKLADNDADGAAAVTAAQAGAARPYFYVVADGARTGLRAATRVVPLEGAANFRDLGGYATTGGKHVRWGQVFRSNGLSALTDADYRTVGDLDVRLVCDLRTDQERKTQPTVWRGGKAVPVFLNSPKAGLDMDMRALFGNGPPSVEAVRANFIGFYKLMPDAYAEEYRAMFDKLLAGDAPMLVHCSAGKDRTGVASALILTALGVPRATVSADYAMSETLLNTADARRAMAAGAKADDPKAAMFAKLPPEITRVLMRTEPAYVEAALEAIEQKYGSVEAYLDKVLGVDAKDLAALRARYLE